MEPQIIDYYNEYPSMMKIIDKMNSEYDELYEVKEQLKTQLRILKHKYEPEPDLNKLIDFSIRTGKHYDISKVFYHIYKDEFKCTSIKYRKWYYKSGSGSEWIECDSNNNQYGVQLRIKLSDMRNIYEKKLEEIKNNVNNGPMPNENFFFQLEQMENCEELIKKYKGKNFYSYILREIAELFYDDN